MTTKKATKKKEGFSGIKETLGRLQPYAVWWDGHLEVFTETRAEAVKLFRHFKLHGPDWRPEHEGKAGPP